MALQNPKPDRIKFTLVEQVMGDIRGQIAGRHLTPGMKLPSIRQSARQRQVSKSTIVEAYDRLAAEGVIEARKGSGFYVLGNLPPFNLSKVKPMRDRRVDPLWVSRQSLEADDSILKPGCGWLPPSWMPQDSIRAALRSLSRAPDAVLTEYGTPNGFVPLRELLVRRMSVNGIAASAEQVMLTESGTQTIDLLCRFFLEPGDTVLVDDPCYFNFHALLKAHRVNVVGVPYTPTGPDIDLFDKALRAHRPRLYITNSAIHNPTGAVLSPAIAHQLLKLADQSNLIVIEDDIFADLELVPAPRLAALDGLQRVVHIGSFSKTLSAAARCGFIAARQDWIEGLIDLKIATTFGGEPFSAELTWRVLKDGTYKKHLNSLRERLSRAQNDTCRQLKNIGIEPWLVPEAGMYLWCRLPGDVNASELANEAVRQGIILAPGEVFSLTKAGSSFLRFNVAQSRSPKIYEFLAMAMHSRP